MLNMVGFLSVSRWSGRCCIGSISRRAPYDGFARRRLGGDVEAETGLSDPGDHEVEHGGVLADPIVENDDGSVSESVEQTLGDGRRVGSFPVTDALVP
jgi:hypothetical protein